MGIFSIIFRGNSFSRIRKEYDRLREKADKELDTNRRLHILRTLDSIEPTIVTLEEQIVSDYEKKRMTKYVKHTLKKVKSMLKDKEYYSSMMQNQNIRQR